MAKEAIVKRGSLLVLALILAVMVASCRLARRPEPATPLPPAAVAGEFSLTVSEPQNETVVSTELLRVVGRTSPDAIVSVNGRIVRYVDVDGNFSTVINLMEGPNLVEVLASDYAGHRASQSLTVVYMPQN